VLIYLEALSHGLQIQGPTLLHLQRPCGYTRDEVQAMTLAQKSHAQVESLPESYQTKVLDFVESLEHKGKNQPAANDDERAEWSRFALSHAMQELEDDEAVYSLEDVRETV
jgi:hypothetical protein